MPPRKKHFKKGQPNRVLRVIKPFQEFMRYEAAGGMILLVCVVGALIISNSIFGAHYLQIWQTDVGFTIGDFEIIEPLIFWVNDLLMFVFFFLIGLEIKREILIGELSVIKNAIAPVIAATGGIIIPALIFLAFNLPGTLGSNAWAIPIATDIAITLGVLSVFGSRIPLSLKIFVTTLAITDDIGGVLIIALVYSEGVNFIHMLLAGILLIILIILNRLGIRTLIPYTIIGIGLWFEFLFSGVHPTIAGILLSLTIPTTTKIDFNEFVSISEQLVGRVRNIISRDPEHDDIRPLLETSKTLEEACKNIEAPLQHAEHNLAKWIVFLIVPIFALANSGIIFSGIEGSPETISITLGIITGLVVGKPLGVILFTWLAIQIKIINMPEGVNWDMMISVAFLTGIGFTISIFIASLAFTQLALLNAAKIAILLASLVSGILGFFSIRRILHQREIALLPYEIREFEKTPNVIVPEKEP
jgi:NhaA family Na+:H+ antiporter